MKERSKMVDSQQSTEKQRTILYILGMVFSVLYLLRLATLWEPFRHDIADLLKPFAWLFCSLILLSSIPLYKPHHKIILICLVLVSLWIGVNCDRLELMYFSSTLIIGAKKIKYEIIIKAYFILGLSFCLFNIIGNQIGFIKDATYFDQSERLPIIADSFFRKSFGYGWCTDFASHVFLIILSYWICKAGVLKFLEMVIIVCLAVFILLWTGTRMAAGCLLLVVLLSLYCRFRNRQRISNIVWFLFILCVPFFAFISIYLTLSYNDTDVVWVVVDAVMSGRLSLGQEAILEKGIPWFGQKYIMYGMGNSSGGDEYNYIDNTYIQYLVINGILATVAFVLCYVRICHKAFLGKNLCLSLAVLLSGFFGLITQFHFNIAYCPLLLATFATINDEADNKI